MTAHYVSAGLASLRGGPVRAMVGALPAMTDIQVLDAKIRTLNADVTAVATDPVVAGFAVSTWAPFFAKWLVAEQGQIDAPSFTSFVQQYNALLSEWEAMGQRTGATRDAATDSLPRQAWNAVTGSTGAAVTAAAVTAATIYLAYDAWESHQRRRR